MPHKINQADNNIPAPLQHPLWIDYTGYRAFPNEPLRSALFNARNRNHPRQYLKAVSITISGNNAIEYTGEELRQIDLTIVLQLLRLARELPPGALIFFTPYAICKAVGWPINSNSYLRLHKILIRLKATALVINFDRTGKIALSIIDELKWKDETSGQALPRYGVKLHPSLIQLFADNDYNTYIDWEQRKDLSPGLATWLHSFYSSHKSSFSYRIETIKELAGLTTVKTHHLRALIKQALKELEEKKVGLYGWIDKRDLLHMARRQQQKFRMRNQPVEEAMQ